MNLTLSEALRYATKPRATAADYHKAFDKVAGDHTGSFDSKAELPVQFYGDHLRSEGHHPQADFVDSALQGAKELGEPAVVKVNTGQFPEKHREQFAQMEPGDFYLHLDRPQGRETHAVLFQKSHTQPDTAYGFLDSIKGSPDEVRAEVERFQQAGVPVDLGRTVDPQSEDYDLWQRHFGLHKEGEVEPDFGAEEPEQYAKKKGKGRAFSEIYKEFISGTDTENWSEAEKKGLENLNKAEHSAIEKGLLSGPHQTALAAAYNYHSKKGNNNLVDEIKERLSFLKVKPLDHAEGERVPFDSLQMETDVGVSEGQPVTVVRTGYHNLEEVGEPLIRTVVSPEGKPLAEMDLKGSRYSALSQALSGGNDFSAIERPIRYSAVPAHELHPDYAPNGVAPRIGHLLGQLAQEDTDAGALAEGILRTGSHDILPILADRLDETGHPLAQEIDWRHAPRAIRIDRALHREIGKRQVRHPDGHRVPLSAGWVIADIEEGVQRPAFSRRKALLHARLAQPDATSEDVAHSLFRLLYDRAAQEDPSMGTAIPEYQRELTKARLQRLGHRPADPFRYTDLRAEGNRKYAAFKAPAGGMVVKQSPLAVSGQWAEGGEFVNDLQKLPTDSVEYKKDRKRKKHLVVEYLRKRLRRVSSGTYTGSTLPEALSEGGGESGE